MTEGRLSEIRKNAGAITAMHPDSFQTSWTGLPQDSFAQINESARLKHLQDELDLANIHHAIQTGKLETSSRAVNPVITGNGPKEAAETEHREGISTIAYMVMVENLRKLEEEIARKYGEDFAENLLADLTEQGLIDKIDTDRIMAIGDGGERREAISSRILAGLSTGQITGEDLENHEWADEWLSARNSSDEQQAYEKSLGGTASLSLDQAQNMTPALDYFSKP